MAVFSSRHSMLRLFVCGRCQGVLRRVPSATSWHCQCQCSNTPDSCCASRSGGIPNVYVEPLHCQHEGNRTASNGAWQCVRRHRRRARASAKPGQSCRLGDSPDIAAGSPPIRHPSRKDYSVCRYQGKRFAFGITVARLSSPTWNPSSFRPLC
jgi:hypothetical protein